MEYGASLPPDPGTVCVDVSVPMKSAKDALLKAVHVECRRLLPALINTLDGGTLMLGVTSDGKVKGLPLIRKDRDRLQLAIDNVWCDLQPQGDPRLFNVALIPVSIPDRQQAQEFFVLRITVWPDTHPAIYTLQGEATILRGGSVVPLTKHELQQRRKQEQDEYANQAEEALDLYSAELKRYRPISSLRLCVIGARTHHGTIFEGAPTKRHTRTSAGAAMLELMLGCRTSAGGAQFVGRLVQDCDTLPPPVRDAIHGALAPCIPNRSSVPSWILGWPRGERALPHWLPISKENLVVIEVAARRIKHDKDTTWDVTSSCQRKGTEFVMLFDTRFVGPTTEQALDDQDLNRLYEKSKAAARKRKYSKPAVELIEEVKNPLKSKGNRGRADVSGGAMRDRFRTGHVREVPAMEHRALVTVEEGVHYEFKSFQGPANDPFDGCGNVAVPIVVSFLNAVGGVLLIGVSDDGRAVGAEIPLAQRARLLLVLSRLVGQHIRPAPERHLIRTRFISVVPKGKLQDAGRWWEDSGEHVTRNHAVLEVSVLKGEQPVYFGSTWSAMAQIRIGNSVRMMTEELVVRRWAAYLRQTAIHKAIAAAALESLPAVPAHGELTLEAQEMKQQKQAQQAADAEIKELETALASAKARVKELRDRVEAISGAEAQTTVERIKRLRSLSLEDLPCPSAAVASVIIEAAMQAMPPKKKRRSKDPVAEAIEFDASLEEDLFGAVGFDAFPLPAAG